MAIRASSSRQIDELIANLSGSDAVKRDVAIARLTVIGARAVDRLVGVAGSEANPQARAAALRALEGIGDRRALAIALRTVDDPDPAAARAGISVARLFLRGPKGAEVVDRLTVVALDARREDRVRLAAVAALRDLSARTIAPVLTALATDTSAAMREAARSATPEPVSDTRASGSADAVKEWLEREGGKAPLSSLLGIVERAREREAAEPPSGRAEWKAVRFAAHRVLARRKSRVALYDLRESLERAASALPVDALAALAVIGDRSCLEPIASAYTRSKDVWWRDHLLQAFQTIVQRERLTKRHTLMQKIAKKYGPWPRDGQDN